MVQGHYGFYTPRLTPVNKVLVIVTAVFFILHSVLSAFFDISLTSFLGLSVAAVLKGYLYQWITYPLIQPNLMHYLFNVLFLWFLGSELETLWGRRVYGEFLLSSVLGAAVLYTLVVTLFFSGTVVSVIPLVGLGGVVFSLLMAYGTLFPDRYLTFMFIFPMRARYFCLLMAGIEIYLSIFSQFGKASWGHLGAMVSGFAYLRLKSYWVKWKRTRSDSSQKRKSRKKGKGNLYLIKGEEEAKPDPKRPKYWQ